MLVGAVLVLIVASVCAIYGSGVFSIRWSLVLLTLKLASGFIALVYYQYVAQGGDILYYHQNALDAITGSNSGYSLQKFLLTDADPSAITTPQARSFFFIKILTVIYWVIGTHIWLANALFSLLSFVAITYFIKRLGVLNHTLKTVSVFVFFFWPGIAIWGNGIGKESLMLSALLFFVGSLVPILQGVKTGWVLHLFFTLLSFLVLLYIRPFVLMGLLPCLSLWWILHQLSSSTEHTSGWKAVAGTFLLVSLLAFLWVGLDHGIRSPYIFTAFEDAHAAVVARSRPEHVVEGLEKLHQGPALLWQAALAALAGVLGPFVWEISSTWELLLLTEPVLLVMFFFTNRKNLRWPVAIWLPVVIFVLGLSCLITLSTPNYGSLSRYRLAWYPPLLLLLAYGHPWLTKISTLVSVKKA